MQRTLQRLRSWMALAVVVAMVFTLVVPAMAAQPPQLSLPQKLELLQKYNIVRGDGDGNLNLTRPIKRGELVAIIARAMGKDAVAQTYNGLSLFTDTQGHWANGYLSYGRTINLVKGDGNNQARPEDYVNYAEALTLILRAVGKEPTVGTWPTNVLLEAADLKLLPLGVNLETIKDQAPRSDVFIALADALLTVQNAEGKSYFEAYLNPTTPVLNLNSLPASVVESTISVKGTVRGAASVTVNGKQAVMSGEAFEAVIDLAMGANEITVEAADLAGVTTRQKVTVTRGTAVADLSIEGPSKVGLNASAKYVITALDAAGKEVANAAVAGRVEGNIGTFDAATGVLKAAGTAGTGRIVVTAGSVSKNIDVTVSGLSANAASLEFGGAQPTVFTKPMTVQVQVRDANGAIVADDFGRSVTLSALGATGVTITPAIATTTGGVATFTVKAAAVASVELQATTVGLTTIRKSVEFTTSTYVALIMEEPTLIVGGVKQTTRVRAELRDESGNAILNKTGEDIRIQLLASGVQGDLLDDLLTIRKDTSSATASGDEGLFGIGSVAGSVTLSGKFLSSHNLTVNPARLQITKPSVGTGSRFVVLAPNGRPAPNGSGMYFIRVEDANGNLIDGEYAFQVSVTTSNGETGDELTNSLTVSLGDTGRSPLSDGKSEGSTDDGADVIGRTVNGTASVVVTYDKPGLVTLTVKGVGGTDNAWDDDGNLGEAVNGTNLDDDSVDGFWYEEPTKVVLKADSDAFGDDQSMAAGSTARSKTVTVRAYFTNANGYWIPQTNGEVELTHTGTSTRITNRDGVTKATVKDGKAEFAVTTTNEEGIDTYTVSSATLKLSGGVEKDLVGDTLDVQVDAHKPSANTVQWARGYKGADGTGDFYVAPDDDGLELELNQDSNNTWVVVRFYYGSTLLYTSEAIDISDSQPKVQIPKDKLKSGKYKYKVVVRNGYGDSEATETPEITNAGFSTGIKITGARYDGTGNRLYISGSGFADGTTTNPTAGVLIDPSLLTIKDPLNLSSATQQVDLFGARLLKSESTQLTLDMTGASALLNDRTLFSGNDVVLLAERGWYTSPTGAIADEDTSSNPVTPMAYIAYGAFDRTNNRLTVVGAGFQGTTMDWSKVKVNGVKLSGYGNGRLSDTQWYFTITSDVTGMEIVTEAGWAKSGSTTSAILQPVMTNKPIFRQVKVTAAYAVVAGKGVITLKGTGFTGASIDPTLVTIKDLSNGADLTLSADPVVTDTKIEFTLTADETTSYSSVDPDTGFKGSDIYVLTAEGWYTQGGEDGAPIVAPQVRMPTK